MKMLPACVIFWFTSSEGVRVSIGVHLTGQLPTTFGVHGTCVLTEYRRSRGYTSAKLVVISTLKQVKALLDELYL